MSNVRHTVEILTYDTLVFITTVEAMLDRIIDLDLEITKLNEVNSVIYNNAADLVYSALDDKGKPLYSNQEKRDLAIQSHLSTNSDYKLNQLSINEKQTEKKRLDVKVDSLRNKIRLNNNNINFYTNVIKNE